MSDHKPIAPECLMSQAEELSRRQSNEQSSLAATAGSAAASADKWAEEGRQSLRKANDAISEGKFGTADAYRQSAALAFANEIELRKQPNAQAEPPRK